MLKDKDLQTLAPYLEKGRVVNLEVKDRGKKGREVMLEYADGQKMVGNLDDRVVKLRPYTGFTSIASYFARGKYGSSGWLGELFRTSHPGSPEFLQTRYFCGPGRRFRYIHRCCKRPGIHQGKYGV